MDFERFNDEDLLLASNNLMCEYNKARVELRRKVEGYFRQSIASSYYKETDLIDSVKACESIKQNYLKVRDILAKRGGPILASDKNMFRESNDYMFVKY